MWICYLDFVVPSCQKVAKMCLFMRLSYYLSLCNLLQDKLAFRM